MAATPPQKAPGVRGGPCHGGNPTRLAGLLAGHWYHVGPYAGFVDSNCPSFFPLPPATPGTAAAYSRARGAGALPTHVQKTSACGFRPGAPPFDGCFDRWQLGSYDAGVAYEYE